MSVNSGSLLKPGESSNEYKTSYQSELASNQLYVVDVYNNSELTSHSTNLGTYAFQIIICINGFSKLLYNCCHLRAVCSNFIGPALDAYLSTLLYNRRQNRRTKEAVGALAPIL